MGHRTLKAFVPVVLILAFAAPAWASIAAGLGVSYFSPSDPDFRSIYGGGPLFRAGMSVGIAERIDLWFDGGIFSRSGSLTYTLEETKLSLLPLGVGADCRFGRTGIRPYVGAGVLLVFFRESNILGEVKDQAIGGTVRAGVTIPLSGRLAADLRVAYSFCRMEPADFEFSVGGFEVGAGLAYSF